jgi:hypothetical protein
MDSSFAVLMFVRNAGNIFTNVQRPAAGNNEILSIEKQGVG